MTAGKCSTLNKLPESWIISGFLCLDGGSRLIIPWLSTCSLRAEQLSAAEGGSMTEYRCITQDPQPVIKVKV